jgi:pimeloyl-ACP methyl ester carboxylesterase
MATLSEKAVELDDVRLQVFTGGEGEPLVVLHGVNGIEPGSRYLEALAEKYQVFAPVLPGFGDSTRPQWMDTVDDFSYFFLQLLKALGLKKVHLLGFSLGGWIAAEMAVKSSERFKSLVLVDAVGIKVSGRETADIADMFVLPLDELLLAGWHDPNIGQQFHPSYDSMSEEEKVRFFQNR